MDQTPNTPNSNTPGSNMTPKAVLKKAYHLPENHFLTLGVTLLVIALVIVNSIVAVRYITSPDKASFFGRNSSSSAQPARVLTTQAPIKTGSYTITISNSFQSPSPVSDAKAGAGNTFLGFTISITNTAGKDFPVNPSTQLFVRDRQGNTYSYKALNFDNALRSDTLPNGQTLSGQVAFEIPRNLARPILYIDLGWDQIQPIAVSVLD